VSSTVHTGVTTDQCSPTARTEIAADKEGIA
jgi:hypothetical protein